jgi:hypothetical protein
MPKTCRRVGISAKDNSLGNAFDCTCTRAQTFPRRGACPRYDDLYKGHRFGDCDPSCFRELGTAERANLRIRDSMKRPTMKRPHLHVEQPHTTFSEGNSRW